jgi:hypothetical protein
MEGCRKFCDSDSSCNFYNFDELEQECQLHQTPEKTCYAIVGAPKSQMTNCGGKFAPTCSLLKLNLAVTMRPQLTS